MGPVARTSAIFAYLPGSPLALIGAGDRRRVDWRFLAFGLPLSRWIPHQRLSLGAIASAMQALSARLPAPAATSPPKRGRRAGSFAAVNGGRFGAWGAIGVILTA
jgi:hypothetical protein